MEQFTLLIPAATGLEAVVKRQLAELGYGETKAINGRVRVDNCGWKDVARLNMFLRSGERVLINAAEFCARDFDELFEGVRNVRWDRFLTKDSAFTVVTKTVQSRLTAHHSIQSVGKKAVAVALAEKFGSLPETGAETVIELAIFQDTVSVNIDTTGTGLHKRGYRTLAYTAPLKETTAAALIDLSVWNPDKTFSDIFCGSGTLPIECALKALNIAPGINRRFAYCGWKCVPSGTFEDSVSEARDKIRRRPTEIIASDISPDALSIAKFHAKKAGVESYIKFSCADAARFADRSSYGVNISNPPYGERLGSKDELFGTAEIAGEAYRRLDKWNFYILSPFQEFERAFGRRADKKRYIFNAGIKCTYYSFNGPKPPKNNRSVESAEDSGE